MEYQAIVDAGFLLQIDDPLLINYYVKNPDLSVDQCRAWAEGQIEAINHALAEYSRGPGALPHLLRHQHGPPVSHDMEMKDYIDIVLKIRAGAFSFEASNPRHEHEWKIWEDVKLPEGKLIIPGVITQSSVVVEHPELIAQRLERFAGIVGREKRHRRQRLRLRHPGPGGAGNTPRHRLGQVPGHVRGSKGWRASGCGGEDGILIA